ncbi:MAG: N-6 DNA methylase [Aestuariivita sp.]|nr:N-6 DNA methylase [Aestuariivita sp.]
MAASALARRSERRSERLLDDLLTSQGWDDRKPPRGDVYLQREYRADEQLAEALSHASKTGSGIGIPEAMLMDDESGEPLAVIKAKADAEDIDIALAEAEGYGQELIASGFLPLAIGLAGTDGTEFRLRVSKWDEGRWLPVTYDDHPINWIPSKDDCRRLVTRGSPSEIRPSIPPIEVLAQKADEINRLLREADIKDEFRPAHVAAVMLSLWQTRGNIRRDSRNILQDVNTGCRDAYMAAGKANLASSIRLDRANKKLAERVPRIATILERLNVTVLTAEHDYLGQLYETFFRYTGGNTIGQYFTPRHIARMMVDLCGADSKDSVIDIACGTGGFFVAYMDRLVKVEHLSRTEMVKVIQKRIVGFESEPVTAALCAANMILRGDGSNRIRQADSLTVPNFPVAAATVALMNPPFPHQRTDTPVEDFVERGLDALQVGGKLAVIVPTSLLVKGGDKGNWRKRILKSHSLLAVCQLPDELFQPFASVTTSFVLLEKGRKHRPKRRTSFVRLQHDGLVLKKGVRVQRDSEPNQITEAVDAIENKLNAPGFCASASVSENAEWSVGAYIASTLPSNEELCSAVDIQLRRMASFYTRYAPNIVSQRRLVDDGEIKLQAYRNIVSRRKLENATSRKGDPDTVGGRFDILYGLGEIESRENVPPGNTLVISPTEQYNGCDGWYDFHTVLRPPFITVARTGSIGEAFVQVEPCAPNSDCLVLLPRRKKWATVPELILTAATMRSERWRYNYGRKITPDRIASVSVAHCDETKHFAAELWKTFKTVIAASLAPYQDDSA